MVYIGQTRSRALIAELASLGFGEMVQPNEYPPRRRPWAQDNAAYKAWRAGIEFDGDAFLRHVERIAADQSGPDFLVVPDRVAGGLKSLALSLSWVPRLTGIAPLYLAIQDGMTPADVEPHLGPFAGFFVGGTLRWKCRAGSQWVEFAHRHGIKCHIGRVGTSRRAAWALRIGADSIDSCLPLWSAGNLKSFLYGLSERQKELFA